jgi:hypothetical protein
MMTLSKIFLLPLLLLSLLPLAAGATATVAAPRGEGSPNLQLPGTPTWGTKASQTFPAGTSYASSKTAVQVFFERLKLFWQSYVMKYGLAVMVLLVMVGGFMMMSAHGEEENFTHGVGLVKTAVFGSAGLIAPAVILEFFAMMQTANSSNTAKIGGSFDTTFEAFLQAAMQAIINISAPIAVLALAVGAGFWIFSFGNQNAPAKGWTILRQVAIGLLVISFSYSIIAIASKLFFGQATGTSSEKAGILEGQWFDTTGGVQTIWPSVATAVIWVLGPVALVAILVAAYIQLVSEDADHIDRARRILLYAAAGLALATLSYAIVNAVLKVSF